MKKTIVILLTLILTLCLGVSAAADDSTPPVANTDPIGNEASLAPIPPTDPQMAQAEENDATSSEIETTVPEQNGTEAESTNPFAALFEMARAHTSEIFSALAAILSCVIAFAYRRGLLPLLKQGIGSLASTVNGIDRATEAAREQLLSEAADSRQLTERITESVELLSHEVDKVLSRFDTLERDKAESELLLSTLATEVDLLGEIFLSSSLPEYRKEIVGNTVARLKEQLAARKEA